MLLPGLVSCSAPQRGRQRSGVAAGMVDVASPVDHYGRGQSSFSFADVPHPVSPRPLPSAPRGTPSCPAPLQTASSLPCVLSAASLAGSTSPRRTRCGWGHGGSASSGPEQPPSSSPSPSWGTPSASQVRDPTAARIWGWGARLGACILTHISNWGHRGRGRASSVEIVIPTKKISCFPAPALQPLAEGGCRVAFCLCKSTGSEPSASQVSCAACSRLPLVCRIPAVHRYEGVRGSSAKGWEPQKSIGSGLWENS